MQTIEYRGTITALSSISHNGGEVLGINTMLRREKFVQPDGSVEKVPVVSGNGLRGLLRDRGMFHMCTQLGLGNNFFLNEEDFSDEAIMQYLQRVFPDKYNELSWEFCPDGFVVSNKNGEKVLRLSEFDAYKKIIPDFNKNFTKGLTKQAFYFLFSGGALSSDASGTINIEQARKLKELIPLVGIFGGAMGNQIMPGKLKMGKAIPICNETKHVIPDGFVPENTDSIWEYCQREMYVRTDDAKNEHLQQMIQPPKLKQIAPKELDLLSDEEKEEIEKEVLAPERPQQMMYYVETLSAGTQFYWDIILEDVTDIELEAFLTTLSEFSKYPRIGGKSNVGLGKVKIEFKDWLTIAPNMQNPDRKQVSFKIGELYKRHLEQNKESIIAELGNL